MQSARDEQVEKAASLPRALQMAGRTDGSRIWSAVAVGSGDIALGSGAGFTFRDPFSGYWQLTFDPKRRKSPQSKFPARAMEAYLSARGSP